MKNISASDFAAVTFGRSSLLEAETQRPTDTLNNRAYLVSRIEYLSTQIALV